jgi:hypothetical protein
MINSGQYFIKKAQFSLNFSVSCCRKGVLTGEYVEHLASMGAGTETEVPKTFNATTTSSEAFSPSGKTGAQLLKASSREDIKLKYGKYGKVEPLGDGSGGCFATLTQLAYSQPPMASASSGDGTRACEDRKINEFIWSGSNVGDSKVPKSVKAQKMAGERRQKLATEAKRNPYLTTEKASVEKKTLEQNFTT